MSHAIARTKAVLGAAVGAEAAPCVFVGGAVSALVMTVVDLGARQNWHGVSRLEHGLSVAAMMTAVAGLGAVLGGVPVAAAMMLRSTRRRNWVPLVLCLASALATVLLTREGVRNTFMGVAERSPELATRLTTGLLAVLAAGTMVVTLAVDGAARAKRVRWSAVVGLTLVVLGSGIAWADAHVLVALYASAHEVAEMAAWAATSAGGALLAWSGARAARSGKLAMRAIALVTVLWTAFFLQSKDSRAHLIEGRLAHVWREPGHATRMCLRWQLLEGYLRDPSAWRGSADARMRRLIERYDIASVKEHPKWQLPADAPLPAPPARRPMNVVVVFVDTLRADTAADARVMPHVDAFRKRSLSFERAYAAASDTISSLPVLTGGCSGAVPCEGDMLRFAERRGIPTGLVIAKSARRFLAKHAPHFSFSDVVELSDYAEGKKVWGYGADESTADDVTTEALAWIQAHRDQQFLLWAFHFDVHNWMNLAPERRGPNATSYAAAHPQGDKLSRYNAASAGVDGAIGALIEGIASAGLADHTAILLVSDHGEALGHRGHAFHAVYLWDSLVHVPLVLQVPGVAAGVVDTPTGHVDVTPTVVSLLEPTADLRQYHGVSLLADADARSQALPLLMFSMRRDDLLRVGIVSRQAPFFKLELPFDSVVPELYDLGAADADARDVSATQRAEALSLLSELVTSPAFPRAPEEPNR